jgi:hypothetical protein
MSQVHWDIADSDLCRHLWKRPKVSGGAPASQRDGLRLSRLILWLCLLLLNPLGEAAGGVVNVTVSV